MLTGEKWEGMVKSKIAKVWKELNDAESEPGMDGLAQKVYEFGSGCQILISFPDIIHDMDPNSPKLAI